MCSFCNTFQALHLRNGGDDIYQIAYCYWYTVGTRILSFSRAPLRILRNTRNDTRYPSHLAEEKEALVTRDRRPRGQIGRGHGEKDELDGDWSPLSGGRLKRFLHNVYIVHVIFVEVFVVVFVANELI